MSCDAATEFPTVEYSDERGSKLVFQPTGELFVRMHPGVEEWALQPAKPGDVGMDLPVRIKNMQESKLKPKIIDEMGQVVTNELVNFTRGTAEIPPNHYATFPSGLYVKLPEDAWAMVRGRSSTGWKKHLSVFEGTIDSGYTGQIACLVFNPTSKWANVSDGDCLAQLVIVPKYPLHKISVVDELPETTRGETGFGSTGNRTTS